ncbi:MAG: helix-turn-helix transcriptional regulator [Bacilli bacterium]|nr:helix-turn-helix transcriptional regulator [Bacilli bacterium]
MNKLKELRIINNYSVVQLAKKIGISPSYYWQIENKKRRLYYNIAVKIAKVFNLKPDDIFYDDF